MMKTCLYAVFIFCLTITSAYAASPNSLIAGGRLYDKWWVDTELPEPSETHPAYPAEGKKKGSTTWRCKECHGWDYRGKEGAYQKGSHVTGIKGIQNMAGAKPGTILQILTNDTHQYGIKLPDSALQSLAQFVSQGQMDMSQYIDGASKKVKGNPGKGKTLFKDNCQKCHGKQGNALNLSHKKDKAESVGSIANANPWETLHKIRFGHPGAVMGMAQMHSSRVSMSERHRMGMPMWKAMPPMFDKLSETEQIDLLVYLQSLPR